MRSQTITTVKDEEPERMVFNLKGAETPSRVTKSPSGSDPEQSIITYFRSLPPGTVLKLKGGTDADEATDPVVSTLPPINVTQVTARSDVQRNAQRSLGADEEDWDPSPNESKGTVLISQEDLMAFVRQRILSGHLQTRPKNIEPEECHALLAESQEPGRRFEGDNWAWGYSCAGYAGNEKTEDRIGADDFTLPDGTRALFSGVYDGHGGEETKAMVSEFAKVNAGEMMKTAFIDGYAKGLTHKESFENGLTMLRDAVESEYKLKGKNPNGLRGGAMSTISVIIPSANECWLANLGDAEITVVLADDSGNEEIVSVFAKDTYDDNDFEKKRIHAHLSKTFSGDETYGLLKDGLGHTRVAGFMPSSALGDCEARRHGMGNRWKVRMLPIESDINGSKLSVKTVTQNTDGVPDAHDLLESLAANEYTQLSRENTYRKVYNDMQRPLNVPGLQDDPAGRILSGAMGCGTQYDISRKAAGSAYWQFGRRDDIAVAVWENLALSAGTDQQSHRSGVTTYQDWKDKEADEC